MKIIRFLLVRLVATSVFSDGRPARYSQRLGLLGLVCAVAAMGIGTALAQTATEAVLHTFTGRADGGVPDAGVLRDPAGNLYGTAQVGGRGGHGVVYKVDPARHYTVLYSFSGGADGSYPQAGVIRDPAGNLYGTTYIGGAENWGVVYRLDAAGNETVLHSFTRFHEPLLRLALLPYPVASEAQARPLRQIALGRHPKGVPCARSSPTTVLP
jgi:uncharacterized repeat protein (TIGR03803 family)